ncbi:MAG: hypothetical protein HXY22_03680 [Alphaproteobacteria bacterium]|nr:hypothetical protein [Alphaproteobacteria bacterium]
MKQGSWRRAVTGLASSSALALATACSTLEPGYAPRIAPVHAPAIDPAFAAFLAKPENSAGVEAFETYLKAQGVADIIPASELLRTGTDWEKCAASAFALPPLETWTHIVPTLRLIRDDIIPTIGPVEAVSGYRNPLFNACAGGRAKGAHPGFFALDLVPLKPISRAALIKSLCSLHDARAEATGFGLGFYDGLRFHVDTMRARRWGRDGRRATSPCEEGA